MTQFAIIMLYFYPIGHGIVNWVTTADVCIHTTDATRLDGIFFKH